MKKIFLFLLILIVSILFSHPASDIKIKIIKENRIINYPILLIEIEHKVNTEDHFIESIELMLNNKNIAKQTSWGQTNKNSQLYIYIIPEIKENDRILINTKCNKFGAFKREFVIDKEILK